MLIEQTHYPLAKGGDFPWGTVIVAVLVIGGIGCAGYYLMKPIEPIYEPKTKENDWN